jgi:hypothetical protein
VAVGLGDVEGPEQACDAEEDAALGDVQARAHASAGADCGEGTWVSECLSYLGEKSQGLNRNRRTAEVITLRWVCSCCRLVGTLVVVCVAVGVVLARVGVSLWVVMDSPDL